MRPAFPTHSLLQVHLSITVQSQSTALGKGRVGQVGAEGRPSEALCQHLAWRFLSQSPAGQH